MTLAQLQTGDLVRARGREWIVLARPDQGLLRVRPLSGSEEDAVTLAPALEREPVESASFGLPASEQLDTQDAARLLADALRLSLRRGAGPFRSAAHLGVEPRAYQLVPLLMALRLDVKRLLIADDVGIGKTIEAGMILREMLDRGEIDRFTVLCPPHLVEQWVGELAEKFDIDAEAVTSARARSLERGLALSDSIFTAYPYTVVSLDYIKAEGRRDDFARACPNFVIVDEAHSCVGGGDRGNQQRYTLLERLAEDTERHLLLLTATPHSGNQDAYARLLRLLHIDLASGPDSPDPNAVARYRRRLAGHFVQRRRPDIEAHWGDASAFAKALAADAPYTLTGDFLTFQEDVLDYCLGIAIRADGERARRLAFWGTLALMRCVGSSPAAAAAALRNRLGGMAEETALEPILFDEDEGTLSDTDVEPATAAGDEETHALQDLIGRADALAARTAEDPKFRELIRQLKGLIAKGVQPVVFCRFITTAEAVGVVLAASFKKHKVETVTGRLTPEERRTRVAAMHEHPQRILVATDCLSEGINLQELFDAVLHFDLNWNPTRHQQREGRVDRFGQPSAHVWAVMMFGANSMIDGAVIQVITEKARRIAKETGVTVPIPEDSASVTSALMQAMLLRSNRPRAQGTFDFGQAEAQLETEWRDAEANAKKSRAIFAQGALKPEDVLPEWQGMRALTGGPKEVERFTRRALERVGARLSKAGDYWRVDYDQIEQVQLRERLKARGLIGARAIDFADKPRANVAHVGRVHPLVAMLAENMAEGALDPRGRDGDAPLGRAGAWLTHGVEKATTLLLLRLRFTMVTSGRANNTLLAEEATALAFTEDGIVASGPEALALLEAEASGNIERGVIARRVAAAIERVPGYDAGIRAYAEERAGVLRSDHQRVTKAAGGGATTDVQPVLPADIIGLYVLIPEAR